MSGLDIGVSRGDVIRWAAEEEGSYHYHQQRFLWWRHNVLIGLFVEVVSLVLAVVIWPVGIASIVGAVMIARGVREMHREKSAAQHHLHEHYKWAAIKEVW